MDGNALRDLLPQWPIPSYERQVGFEPLPVQVAKHSEHDSLGPSHFKVTQKEKDTDRVSLVKWWHENGCRMGAPAERYTFSSTRNVRKAM